MSTEPSTAAEASPQEVCTKSFDSKQSGGVKVESTSVPIETLGMTLNDLVIVSVQYKR